ncbi:ATP-binding cassette domain-containing protein [Neobacillus cucumis]|uniref:Teichoic acid ABC transporter ATP-binding protein n=1 Tax=Neobacillus cucumis TaxID=1740721 RepID=A0A2N5H7M2_9BACI|nr:ATP-binding cassette domain-containing protein [Neobacillus cucumis]PLS01498.1 teichoic acid ABC transporter ATP-binding protein [Neobacillus cucumis]
MEPIVKFHNVYKTFSFYKNQTEKLMDILSIKKKKKSFSALRGISFEVFKGESIGVIGINGSGKSTLSNLLAQIGVPSSGNITLKGESSLIAIAAGLNNNLSGFENIHLKCLMMGLKNEEIKKITPQIMEFADIGDFIYQPVKNYSSGMKSRLGFAISIHTNPDILIIDEALSVGDQTFYEKCIKKMEEFKSVGKTIFFISHSISQVRNFCDRVLWLHFGEIKTFGNKDEVLKEYKEFIDWYNQLTDAEKKQYKAGMLNEQFDNKNMQSRSGNRTKKRPKGMIKRVSFLGQLIILLTLLLISTIFLTKGKHPSSTLSIESNDTSKSIIQKKVNNTPVKIMKEPINKKGYLLKEKVDIYSDSKLKHKIVTLPFATPISIQEKRNDSYKVTYDGKTGYINTTDATISEQETQPLNLSIDNLQDSLPSAFSRSYEFYLAYLGADYNNIKSDIRGLTEETTDSLGNKVQVYRSVSYTFNQNNIADMITVLDIDSSDEIIQRMKENASIKNDEDQLYFVDINGYQTILNLQKNTVSFKLSNQQ